MSMHTNTRRKRDKIITVTMTGAVYGFPCSPGCVAPTGRTETFAAEGTVEQVIKAYTEWERTGIRARTGHYYPCRFIRRFIHGCDPMLSIHTAANGETTHLDYLQYREEVLLPLYRKYSGKRINP